MQMSDMIELGVLVTCSTFVVDSNSSMDNVVKLFMAVSNEFS
jgi:hypothetical protein